MRAWLLLALLAGCYRSDSFACAVRCGSDEVCPAGLNCNGPGTLCRGPDDECPVVPLDDASVISDVPLAPCPAGQARYGTGTGFVTQCFSLPTLLDRTLAVDIDTDSACDESYAHLTFGMCVILGGNITINNTSAHGNHTLVIAATGTITITGLLDVASRTAALAANDFVGPGATNDIARTCAGGGGNNTNTGGGGGGAGGRFVGAAGNGGTSPNANAGQARNGDQLVDQFRPGCAGGGGGSATQATGSGDGGRGGNSGGAVYLLANEIRIETGAHINASGAGGGETPIQSGGGGGGSGGFIGLDAPSITINIARLFALGGGGSAGGTPGVVSSAGNIATAPTSPAVSVADLCSNGSDGDGGGGSSLSGDGEGGGLAVDPICGGGGGGGGHGAIRYAATTIDVSGSAVILPIHGEMP